MLQPKIEMFFKQCSFARESEVQAIVWKLYGFATIPENFKNQLPCQQPSSLHMSDLKSLNRRTCFSHKIDGTRAALVFLPTGVYLVGRNMKVYQVKSTHSALCGVLDVEIVFKVVEDSVVLVSLILDIVNHNFINFMKATFETRKKYLDVFLAGNGAFLKQLEPALRIERKTYWQLNDWKRVPFNILCDFAFDGIIVHRFDSNISVGSSKGEFRVKFHETIDLRVTCSGKDGILLHAWDRGCLVNVTDKVAVSETQCLKKNGVWEFIILENLLDKRRLHCKPFYFRDDKTEPNDIFILNKCTVPCFQ
jgi:hypothetical protein